MGGSAAAPEHEGQEPGVDAVPAEAERSDPRAPDGTERAVDAAEGAWPAPMPNVAHETPTLETPADPREMQERSQPEAVAGKPAEPAAPTLVATTPRLVAAVSRAMADAPPPARSAAWGILCRVAGPGSVAGHGIRLDGRVAHFWEAGSRGYFSQASVDKLPRLLVPEPEEPARGQG